MTDPGGTVSMPDGVAGAESGAEPALILVLRGDHPLGPPLRVSLADADSVVIGRGKQLGAHAAPGGPARSLAVTVPDRHISSTHLRLLRAPYGQWIVQDSGSKNGIALNGARCDRATLSNGDVIDVGCSSFLYRVCPAWPVGEAGRRPVLDPLVTMSAALAASFASIGLVAGSGLSILLMGQSGVGKEVVARAVHELSGRRGAFVAVNCAAIPPNLVESTMFGHRRGSFSGATESRAGMVRRAEGGTLFLDEIGELSPPAQASLLRVVQEREVVPVGESEPIPVDVRFVAATNRDLWSDVEAGRFREDLLARLTGLTVRLPPLRERREDLGLLVARLLRRVSPEPDAVRMTPRASRALVRYDWPRNVRELESCLSAAILLAEGKDIDLHHLPAEIQKAAGPATPSSTSSAPDQPRPSIAALMDAHDGNISAVARALATSRSQVRRLLKRESGSSSSSSSTGEIDP
ncbi:MAG TPA: sigma 54-interacting transcriptional regulator [Kofleriaceae bacterium]|nr:sigma 54-interacting transcriptional regulator [Kofleriaceae bacterium]